MGPQKALLRTDPLPLPPLLPALRRPLLPPILERLKVTLRCLRALTMLLSLLEGRLHLAAVDGGAVMLVRRGGAARGGAGCPCRYRSLAA